MRSISSARRSRSAETRSCSACRRRSASSAFSASTRSASFARASCRRSRVNARILHLAARELQVIAGQQRVQRMLSSRLAASSAADVGFLDLSKKASNIARLRVIGEGRNDPHVQLLCRLRRQRRPSCDHRAGPLPRALDGVADIRHRRCPDLRARRPSSGFQPSSGGAAPQRR